MNVPFFPWLPSRARLIERIANIQDQVLEIGTHVRFLEADKRKPQPRDDGGRYVSKRTIVSDQLRQYVATTTPSQRKAETEAYFEKVRGRG